MKMAVCVWYLLIDVISRWLAGGNLNAASRQALMQKLARIEPAPTTAQPMFVHLSPYIE